MKKLLALVLALVMVLGLATVGTNAATAYSDANDINYKEAVEVMSAVGVLKGDANGFRPADSLKRSEGAKIVAYLLLGNKTAESIVGTGNKFTDVPASHWAVGYIEYLASIGVINGVGDGKFAPDATLTGVQFAKMLLVGLGYDAELEGLVGEDWSINTQKLANSNDLFAGMDELVASATITREQAAQCCLNALEADMVKYADKGTTVKIGESTVVTGASNAEKDPDNSKDYNGDADGRQLVESLYGNDLQKKTGEADDFGAPANKWIYKNEEVGTFSATSDIIYTKAGKAKTNALYDLIGKTSYDNIVATPALLEVFVDGAAKDNTLSNYFVKDTSKDVAFTGNGTFMTIYKQDALAPMPANTYKYTIVIKNTYAVQATDDYNKTSESVNIEIVDDMDAPAGLPNKIKQEDFDVSGVKEDDYLIVTFAKGDIQSVAPATVAKGEVSTYKLSSNVTLDGTKYEYNAKVLATGKDTQFDVGSDAKLILDDYGYIVFVDEAESSEEFAFLQDIENNKTNNATLYFTDGTTKTVTVKKFEFNAAPPDTDYANFDQQPYVGRWFTYSVDSNSRYTLKELDNTDYTEVPVDQYAVGDTITEKDKVTFLNTAEKANSETVVIVLDNDEDVTIYKGIDNIPTVRVTAADSDTKAYVGRFNDEDDIFVKYVFIDASGVKISVDDSVEADNYMFVLKNPGAKISVAGDKTYSEADVLMNGELQKNAKIKFDSVGEEGYAAGLLFKNVKTNSDGYYTSADLFVDDANEKQVVINSDTVADPITFNKGVVSFGVADFVLNSKNVTLIYAKGCEAMKDSASDYEINTVTGSGLASALKNYACVYSVYVTLAEKNSEKVDTMYVYVRACSNNENIVTFNDGTGYAIPDAAAGTLQSAANKYYIISAAATFTFADSIETVESETMVEGVDYEIDEDDDTMLIVYRPSAAGTLKVTLVAPAP